MTTTAQIAKHLREVHFGGNWTVSNLKEQLTGVTLEQALTQVHGFNTIATLTYHINYYIHEVIKVLEGQPLTASDKYAFAHPPFGTQQEWDDFLNKCWDEAEHFASLIEKLPDSILAEDFTDPKYGTWYRNFAGIIEHSHYHLGQIALIKKLVKQETTA